MLRGLRRASAVVILYGVLVCVLTWPLAVHLGSQLPANFPGSEFDPLYSGWVLAWESHALVHGGSGIGQANIYHPAPDALFYGPFALGALPYFAPVYLLTGNPTLALNLLFMGAVALTAAIVHLVVYAWTRRHGAGLVAGATFLANRWLLVTFLPTVPHLSVLFYFPLIVFLSASPTLRTERALLLFLLVVLQCSTDVVYVAPAVLTPLLVLATFRLARRSGRATGWRLLAVVVAAAGMLLAIHSPQIAVAAHNPHLAEQTNWRLDPLKAPLNLPDGLMGFMSPLAIPSLAIVLVGAIGILCTLRGWRGSSSEASGARHALLWLVTGILISLPMAVRISDRVLVLPHLALARDWVPFAAALRLPERLRVAALMGMAVLTGLAFAELLRHVGLSGTGEAGDRFRANGLAVVLCIALWAQYATAFGQPAAYGPRLPLTYRLQAPPADSSVLGVLRAAGGPILELPLPRFQPTAAAAHAPAMYRSIFHWQPLLNGYSAYWPAGFADRMRLATRLPDAAALRELRRDTGLRFVLVRADNALPVDAGLAAERQPWLDLAQHGGRDDLELVASDDGLLLFRVGGDPPAGRAER